MASAAAAVSMLPMSLYLHPSRAVASPMCAVRPFGGGHRRGRLSTAVCSAVLIRDYLVYAPVQSIVPANKNESIVKLTLDLYDARELASWYTTPGQCVQVSVPSSGLRPASMEIASAPHSGLYLDLLVRSVPGTTAERLCNLKDRDVVELGPVMGSGFPIHKIYDAKTVLCFAVAEGLSPIRALIRSGYTNNVKLYYGARNQESVPEEELREWKETRGVDVITVLTEPVQYPFLRDQGLVVKDPKTTVAVLVGPIDMQQEVTRALTCFGVPCENIITIPQWYPNY